MGYSNSLTRRRREFANPDVTNNTYAGVLSSPFVAPAVKLAETLTKGYVRQIDGIQNKAVISSLSVDSGLVAVNSCDWGDGNSLDLDERVLTLGDLKVNEALCRQSLLPTWAGMTGARNEMGAGSPEFINFTMATVAANVAQRVEDIIWTGFNPTGTVGDVIGFLSNDGTFDTTGYNLSILGKTGASAHEQAVTTLGFAADVLKIGTGCFDLAYTKAVDECPGILNKPDVGFYVGTRLAGKYMAALATSGAQQGVNLLGTNQGFPTLVYLGIPIHVCPGMPAESLVLTYTENLVVGSNLGTDYASAQYIDAWQYDGSDNVKISMRFGLGCQSGLQDDVVVCALSSIL